MLLKKVMEVVILAFFEVTADSADGMRIFPFQYENIPGKECIDLPIVDQYVVFADYQPDTLEFICNPQYHSYEDILKEFKGKLEKYLPENFPWDERIGRYSYVVYA